MKRLKFFLIAGFVVLSACTKTESEEKAVRNGVFRYLQGVKKCDTNLLKAAIAHKWLREIPSGTSADSVLKGLCNSRISSDIKILSFSIKDATASVKVRVGPSSVKELGLIKEKERGWVVIPDRTPKELAVRRLHHRYRVTNLKITPRVIPIPRNPVKIRMPLPPIPKKKNR